MAASPGARRSGMRNSDQLKMKAKMADAASPMAA